MNLSVLLQKRPSFPLTHTSARKNPGISRKVGMGVLVSLSRLLLPPRSLPAPAWAVAPQGHPDPTPAPAPAAAVFLLLLRLLRGGVFLFLV